MPTRVKDFQTRLNTRLTSKNINYHPDGTQNGSVSISPLQGYSIARNGQITYGSDVPDYRKLIRAKQSATTSLSAFGVRVEGLWQGNVFVQQRSKNGSDLPYRLTEEIYGDLGIPSSTSSLPNTSSPLPAVVTRVHNKAIMGFIKKAIAAQTTLQGGVVLGEIRETIHGFKRPASGIRNFLNSYCNNVRKIVRSPRGVKIRNYTKKRDRVKEFNSLLSDTWLEYKFGWDPLVSDVEDAFKTLVDLVVYKEPVKYIQFRAGDTSNLSPVIDTVNCAIVQLKRVYQLSDEYQEKLYGVISLENGLSTSIGGGGYITLQSIGLDLRSWIPTVYELIPYSFLVDYFTNVNEIINAACFNKTSIKWVNLGTSFQRALKLVSMEMSQASNTVSNFRFDPAPRMPSDVSFSYIWSKKQRSPFFGSLIPSLEFSLPGFGTQAINIAALVSSARYTQGLVKKSLRL